MNLQYLFALMLVSHLALGQNITLEAQRFIASLTDNQRKAASFTVESSERKNWHMFPRTRKGVCYKDLSDEQRKLAISLTRISLSEQGYTKAFEIMKNESLLRGLEGRGQNDTYRDPLNYYFSVFGDPSSKTIWGWRLEGHHLSLNFLVENGKLVSSTPSAMGSNPGIVLSGPEKGKEMLKYETKYGLELVKSLNEGQRKKAVFSDTALPEIITIGLESADRLTPEGIKVSELNASQQKVFRSLLDTYILNFESSFSRHLLSSIEQNGIGNLSFAWAGSLSPGKGTYYRIQGMNLLIEYDNTQSNANHVHIVIRDFNNDFGVDILKQHYQDDHK